MQIKVSSDEVIINDRLIIRKLMEIGIEQEIAWGVLSQLENGRGTVRMIQVGSCYHPQIKLDDYDIIFVV
jgi:hypothetical protein